LEKINKNKIRQKEAHTNDFIVRVAFQSLAQEIVQVILEEGLPHLSPALPWWRQSSLQIIKWPGKQNKQTNKRVVNQSTQGMLQCMNKKRKIRIKFLHRHTGILPSVNTFFSSSSLP
jgi:hypothetical protein